MKANLKIPASGERQVLILLPSPKLPSVKNDLIYNKWAINVS